MTRGKYLKCLPLVILAVAGLFIAIGVTRGEVEAVLEKAVNICLECIGIG